MYITLLENELTTDETNRSSKTCVWPTWRNEKNRYCKTFSSGKDSTLNHLFDYQTIWARSASWGQAAKRSTTENEQEATVKTEKSCWKSSYIEKCLPNLLKFINKYHHDDKYLFWPDLATSHYAKTTIEWLNKRDIPFVPKLANPPNVPQARPIEHFWSILADMVYDGGWVATNHQQLANRIKRQLKKIDLNILQAMMNDVRGKLRKIEDSGPFSIL